jgi:hypothetical protein
LNQSNIIDVVDDIESFIDKLLTHAKEEKCNHSVMDLLDEFFDNNARGTTPRLNSRQQVQQTIQDTGGILLNEYRD